MPPSLGESQPPPATVKNSARPAIGVASMNATAATPSTAQRRNRTRQPNHCAATKTRPTSLAGVAGDQWIISRFPFAIGRVPVASTRRISALTRGHPRHYDDDGLMLYNAAGFALALRPSAEPISPPSWMHFGVGLRDRDEVLALRARLGKTPSWSRSGTTPNTSASSVATRMATSWKHSGKRLERADHGGGVLEFVDKHHFALPVEAAVGARFGSVASRRAAADRPRQRAGARRSDAALRCPPGFTRERGGPTVSVLHVVRAAVRTGSCRGWARRYVWLRRPERAR